jgi:biotin/methionine sulfoxide reductase
VAGFRYADCPGHPAWLPPTEPPDRRHPLWLIANQPATRLHSQLDFGAHSQAGKRRGREVCTLHPDAAAARGIREGDIVRLFNDRGACLAAATLSRDMRPDVVQLPTGAWYDPVEGPDGRPMCGHGNPNMLTRDIGTSSLAQGCTGQLTVAQVERYEGELPPVRAYEPPAEGAPLGQGTGAAR